jgi:L-amino acid N-acyltransferase YncA
MICDATIEDLPAIVVIYNAAIPGRMATADLVPVTIDSRSTWFVKHCAETRPLWILTDADEIYG